MVVSVCTTVDFVFGVVWVQWLISHSAVCVPSVPEVTVVLFEVARSAESVDAVSEVDLASVFLYLFLIKDLICWETSCISLV